MLIYCVEDDLSIAKVIVLTLKQQGYEVKHFDSYETFSIAMKEKKPNLILLDMMLPKVHGLDILKIVRQNKDCDKIDIIVISANNHLKTKLDSFDLGADDYIEKPFDIMELSSRVKSRFRKMKTLSMVEGFELNDNDRSVFYNNRLIEFTEKEFAIIKLLLLNKGEVLTRDEILRNIWGNSIIETRTIDMHVKTIRKKLESVEIQTIYGIGYKML